jgi:hypothetical protein
MKTRKRRKYPLRLLHLLLAALIAGGSADASRQTSGNGVAAIKMEDGYLVVWNQPDTHFTLGLKGKNIRPMSSPGTGSVASMSRSTDGAQNREKKPVSPATVLFAVTTGNNAQGEDAVRIDPIVLLDRGRFIEPPRGVDQEAGKFRDTPQSSRFAATYFRPGMSHQLLFGGGKMGTATVLKRSNRQCISLAASVRLQSSVTVGGRVMALATNSTTLGLPESSRRAPSADERSAILNLVRQAYRQRRVPASLLKSLTVTNLTAIDVDRDGSPEFAGSFRIEEDQKAYLLFLLIGRRGDRYHIDLQRYGQQRESGEDFLDYIDLDGDGVGEVITTVEGYETWEYAIYKKRAGRWQSIYHGGGGGC